MGFKIISISSSPVFATHILGLPFWNFRRCLWQLRVKQCTAMRVVYDLLGAPPFFWNIRGDNEG